MYRETRYYYFESLDGEKTAENTFLETGAENYHVVLFIHLYKLIVD